MAQLKIHQIIQRSSCVGGVATVHGKKLGRYNCDVPRDTCNANTIIPYGANCASHVCAVVVDTRIVIHMVVMVCKVPSMYIVNVAITVVVDAVHWVIRISPNIVG
jgi:hypothetical protein